MLFAKKVEAPHREPAKCKACGVGSLAEGRAWWIDTGTYEDFYGQVYYCSICFTEFANLVDFIPAERIAQMKEELGNAKQQIRELNEFIDSLGSLGINLTQLDRFVKDNYVPLEGAEGRLDTIIERAAAAGEQAHQQRSDDLAGSKSRRKLA